MDVLIVIGLLALNFGISWWNARVVGQVWADSKVVGGFPRLVVWSAAIMSACGFTWVYLFVLTLLAIAGGAIEPQYARAAIEVGYLMIIVPIIGSGLILTVHSWMVAARERTLASYGTAAWNTYAQYHNLADAADSIFEIEHL